MLLLAALLALACLAPSVRAQIISGSDPDDILWKGLNQGDKDQLEGYLQAYPDGEHAGEARTKLAALVHPPPPPAPSPLQPHPLPGPALSHIVAGSAKVIDTGTLEVKGRRLRLYGVAAAPYPFGVDPLQKFIDGLGNTVSCFPTEERPFYQCFVPNPPGPDGNPRPGAPSYDIGVSAIASGLAKVANPAPKRYADAENDARVNHRGLWK